MKRVVQVIIVPDSGTLSNTHNNIFYMLKSIKCSYKKVKLQPMYYDDYSTVALSVLPHGCAP